MSTNYLSKIRTECEATIAHEYSSGDNKSNPGYDISLVAVVDVIHDIHFYRIYDLSKPDKRPNDISALDEAVSAFNWLASKYGAETIKWTKDSFIGLTEDEKTEQKENNSEK